MTLPAADQLARKDEQPDPKRLIGEEAWTTFAAWACDELRLELRTAPRGYVLEDPNDDHPPRQRTSSRRGWFLRRAEVNDEASVVRAPPFETDSSNELVGELLRRLVDRHEPANARPVHQPEAVHELAARLFEAYTLDGEGQSHLAGFHFEDVPLVRLTFVSEDRPPTVSHRFFDELGEPIEWSLAIALGVDRLAPTGEATPRLDPSRRDRMLESAQRHAAGQCELMTIVWAKRAWGRIRFDFGDESVDTEFDGWARTLESPPVRCPQTGEPTFHLATIHGGAIAAAERIAVCAVTGHRHVATELEACTVTGRLAEPDALYECPVTLDHVLPSETDCCRLCGQRTSRPACPGSVCMACRAKPRVAPDDERITALIDAHPGLAKWGHWRLAETRDVWIVEAGRRLKCVHLTFDRESLKPVHAMSALRVASSWRPLSTEQQERLLR